MALEVFAEIGLTFFHYLSLLLNLCSEPIPNKTALFLFANLLEATKKLRFSGKSQLILLELSH